jgi:lipopolysaccharide export system permease protein
MKKLLFRKFLKDNLKFFAIICISISLIVWVIQAVGFLDFVTEDGHSLLVYFSYSVLNFPKIFHRILPFVFFISLFYQISLYESKNELLIFWTNGVNKIQFINVVIIYSILITFFQIFLGSYISPISQHEARSFIRNSNIDFFPSLIKEGKFIDTVEDLTIFIEAKDEFGIYKNIFLNDSMADSGKDKRSEMIYAKKGILVNKNNNRYFELLDGKMIRSEGKKITIFEFDKIDFNISKYVSKSTTYPKIQEAPSNDLYRCIYYEYKKKIKDFKAEYLKCEYSTIKNVKQEFLKRFYKPIYFPLLALISCLLILKSKESNHYKKFKIHLFLLIFLILIISEISLRYATSSNIGIFFFIFFPILSFFIIYFPLMLKFTKKV